MSESSCSIAARPTTPSSRRSGTRTGREGAVEQLRRYLADRIRRGLLAPVEDPALSARMLLETAVLWAVHRHSDPSPQRVSEPVVENSVVSFIARALLGPA